MSTRHTRLAGLLLLLLFAFALRIHDLEGQSMWSDEGLSLYRARQPVEAILQNQIVVDGVAGTDTNPPFYFLLLHGWRELVGERVFLLRYFGALLATLAVPLLYATGRLLHGSRLGMVAALLLAFSPFHVWQAQVLRNYGLLLTLNLLTIYALIRFLRGSRQWSWLALALAAGLVAIYTHFFGFFIFAFGLLALGMALLAGEGRRLLRQRWFWTVLALGLLFMVPIVPLAINRFRAGQQIDFYSIPVLTVVRHALSAFGVGVSPRLTHPWQLWLPAALLFLGGALLAWRRSRTAFWLLLGYQVVPLGLLLLLSLVNPLYNGVRHLLIGLPPFLLLAGWGMVEGRGLWRRVGLSLGALFLIVQVGWLWNQFNAPELVRDDVRGPALYLNETARADDVIVLHDTLISFTFDYYYDGAAPVVAVPAYGQLDVELAKERLVEATAEARRVWFLEQPTPRTGFDRGALLDYAGERWLSLRERRFPSMWLRVQLRGYVPDPYLETLPDTAESASAYWPGVLRLHGYELTPPVSAGREWWPTFYLEQDGPPRQQYSFLFHFFAPDGTRWAQIVQVLGGIDFPPAAWQPGAMVGLPLPLTVPAGLPPGVYEVKLTLVETESGRVVPRSTGETTVTLGEVRVAAAPCIAELPAEATLARKVVRFGRALRLMGAHLAGGDYRPGHRLVASLWWCAAEAPPVDYQTRLQLIDEAGNVVAEESSSMTRSDLPPTAWSEDTLIRGEAGLTVPATAEPGRYQVRLALISPGADGGVAVNAPFGGRSFSLDTVNVVPWELRTDIPAVAHPLEGTFGSPPLVELRGYELDAAPLAGTAVPLTLVWRATTDLTENFDVLVHVVDENGEIVAQADGPPTGGFRPTASWRAGEVIVDERILTLPPDLAPGTYTLWTGLYRPQNWERLEARQGDERQPDDRFLLGQLEVGAVHE